MEAKKAIDKSRKLTDVDIDALMDDWFTRDGDTFTKIRKDGRLGWEETLKEGEAYSSYFLEAPTQKDLVRRAYPLAKDMIIAMEPPKRVTVKLVNGEESSRTDGAFVHVSTKVFDDGDFSVGEKLDVFIGTTVHEGCHLLYTDFNVLQAAKLKSVIFQLFNVLEDERIEQVLGDTKPGFARYLEKSKYYYFDQFYLDFIAKREDKMNLFEKLFSIFLRIIRYPTYLKEEDILFFGHHLLAVKEAVIPYPTNTIQTVAVAEEVFEIFKEFYIEEAEKEKRERLKEEKKKEKGESGSGSGGTSDSAEGEDGDDEDDDSEKSEEEKEAEEKKSGKLTEDEVKKAMDSLSSDAKEILKKFAEEVSGATEKSDKLSSKDTAGVIAADGVFAREVEGTIEVGKDHNTFFTKSGENPSGYRTSLKKVIRFVPAISKVIKGHCKEYKLIHRSMRSGAMDTTKLAEAFQGVPTVYMREGEVRTDRVAVGVLVDESGSMSGPRISAARDVAVLINEAIGSVPQVDLFIYGHTADDIRSGATEIMIYREKNHQPRYALGQVSAKHENRDGVAIYETALRIRKFTKEQVLLFVISDGAPSAHGYRSAVEHVRKSVERTEQLGFTVVQVCINHSYDPKTMFKHFVILEDMSRLAFELGKVIKKATLKAAKVRVS